jgi:hypothetical protein
MWDVVLVHGPFDGDDGCIEELVERMWVCMCQRCGRHVAWHFNPAPGTECYVRDSVNEKTHAATYVWGGATLPELEHEEERELVAA